MAKRPAQHSDQIAIYARVSGDRQEKEQSIETQLFKLHERVTAEGLSVYAEYLDNPYTGTVINRPALDRLIDDARKGLFCRVLIYDPDRLSRGKPWMRGYLEEQLARAGVGVTYLSYAVEDSKEGRAKDGMLTVFAEWERETIVQRMKDGRERRVREGHLWRGARPFGWRYSKAGEGERYGRLEIVQEEAELVRQIFAWVLDGKGQGWIATEINRRGIPTVNGKVWSPTTVNRVVHNLLHSGQPPINRYQTCEPTRPKKEYRRAHVRSSSVQRPREEWKHITIPLAIVSPEEQRAAEERLVLNRHRSVRNTKHPYLLSGLLRCGWERTDEPGIACGRVLSGTATNRWHSHFHYRCSRPYSVPDGIMRCCRGKAHAEIVEPLVWGQIVILLQHPETLLTQMAEATADHTQAQRQHEAELTAASAALDGIQAKLTTLLTKNLAGLVDDATYQAVQGDLVRQREQAKERLEHAHGALAAGQQTRTRWDTVRAYCAAVADKLAELERPEHFARRQELVRTLITRIWVYPDRISIEGVLPAASADVTVNSTPSTSVSNYDTAGHPFTLIVPLPALVR